MVVSPHCYAAESYSKRGNEMAAIFGAINRVENKRLVHLVIILSSPLFVTVVLFLLFENTATWSNASETAKLGGAAACYAILLSISFGIYLKIEPDDPLNSIRKSLTGNWNWEAKSSSDDEDKHGSAVITVTETGDISLQGKDDSGEIIFEASEILITESRLVFFWEVRLPDITNGVAKLNFASGDDSRVNDMDGFWFSTTGDTGKVKYIRIIDE